MTSIQKSLKAHHATTSMWLLQRNMQEAGMMSRDLNDPAPASSLLLMLELQLLEDSVFFCLVFHRLIPGV